MKKDEKINNCHVGHEATKNKGVPRAKVYKPRKVMKTDVDDKIKTMINKILDKYTYEKCMLIAGTSENIPTSLLALLVPSDFNDLSVWNLAYHYRMYQHGKYDVYEFLCKVESLFNSLSREFDDLAEFFWTGRIERKEENGYERT